jgi:putative tricarboxylic transport membrane protein
MTKSRGEGVGARGAIGAVLVLFALLAIVLPGGSSGEDDGPYPSRRLDIMAPAAPGGGWDTTAREFQGVIRNEKLGEGAEVFNVDGAGGTLGLSELVSKDGGNPHQLMVMGLVMLGAIATNGTQVDISDTTPIATLTTEPEAIVVPTKSKYKTLDDLTKDLKADASSIRWAGGSAGGTDQLLVGQLTDAIGGEPGKTKYIAYSGGGEANAAILSGSVDAGVSGLSEFKDLVEAKKMRLLAVSSPTDQKIDGTVPKTIKQLGVDLELTNWRGIVAPPDLSAKERKKVTAFVQKVLDTPSWRKARERNDWGDFVKTGPELDEFLDAETKRVNGIVDELGIGG